MKSMIPIVILNSAIVPLMATSSLAQEATRHRSLEEVVVTASKRDGNLQDLPISVAAVDGNQLANRNITDIANLQKAVPSISFIDGVDSNNTSLSIRGIGSRLSGALASAVEPSVGIVIDGVVMGRTAMGLNSFNDVERVEVLRGPQGTLFGMNSSAGIMNIVTRNPTSTPAANLLVSYGTYNAQAIKGSLSGPVSGENLLGIVSFYTEKRDGYIHNIFDGRDFNDENQRGVRGKLLYLLDENSKLTLSLDATDRDRNCCTPVTIDASHLTDAKRPPGPFPAAWAYANTAYKTSTTVNNTGFLHTVDKNRGVSLQWDQGINDFTLTSITAFRTWKNFILNTLSLAAPPPATPFSRYGNDQNQISQELRLASPIGGMVDYVGGVFLFRQRLDNSQHTTFNMTTSGLPVTLDNNQKNEIQTLNYAAFGDANIHIADNITLIAGARWTHVKLDMDILGIPANPNAVPGYPSIGGLWFVGSETADTSASNWSGRLGVQWNIEPNKMAYATISRGFKGPAFNGTVGKSGDAERVDPETSTNYEIGLKSQFFDDSVRANISAFYTEFKDFQALGTRNASSVEATPVLINAKEMVSKGVEFELQAIPLTNLNINWNLAYVRATYESFKNAPCATGQACPNNIQDLSGRMLPAQPMWSSDINSTYRIDLPESPFDGFVRLGYNWRGTVVWDPNLSPATREGAYGTVNGAFGVEGKEDKYKLTFYVENFTNKRHGTISVSPAFGYAVTQFLPPDYQRTYGVSLELKM